MDEKSKRSRIVVKTTLQLKYAAVVLVAMLVTVVTVGADFYIRLHGFIQDFLKDLPGYNVEELMTNMNQLMYAKIIVLLIIAIAISLYISHKFAGPIVHIEKSIEKVSTGDLTHKVYFRSGDELKHLAHYFNYMVGKMKQAVENDRKITHRVMGELEKLKDKVIDEEAKNRIGDMQTSLQKVTEYWKVD
ncbi:HAMP domain-containing protein [Elusimicrobiota bacterium]